MRNPKHYAQSKNREQFLRSGVYILIGQSEDDNPMLYIGQAGDTIQSRINQHYANKEFWQEVIGFTQKDENDPLNRSQVQYLESHLVELAKENKNWKLDNDNDPKSPKLSEPDKADAIAYLDEILLILPVLGVDLSPPEEEVDSRQLYYFKGSDWDATGYAPSKGFLVRKGSRARLEPTSSMKGRHKHYYRKREQLIEDKILVKESGGYRFADDYLFNSPSQAASICAGYGCNGPESWKDANGRTLNQHKKDDISRTAPSKDSGAAGEEGGEN